MIQYALKCEAGHAFESWFQSAAAFEALSKSGHLSCAVCGSADVTKAVMAPRVSTSRSEPAQTDSDAPVPVLKNPSNEVETALAQLRRKVEENSDYVGDRFASEARAMHLGDKPERAIYGEAKLEEARQLAEDGVPVLPLPFTPKKKLS